MANLILPEFYTLPFLKMQALGNDFIFLDGEQLLQSAQRPLLSQWQHIVPNLARRLCNRRLSIGADGLILAMPLNNKELRQMAVSFYGDIANDCQLSWTYHNSDGSQSHMCGNGLRSLALWAKLEKNLDGPLQVATQNGPVAIEFINDNNISAVLGAPKLNRGEIPFIDGAGHKDQLIGYRFAIDSWQFPITCINVGNPHCVIFEADFLSPAIFGRFGHSLPVTADSAGASMDFFPPELTSLAKNLETDKRFPEGTNVEFVRVLDKTHLQMFVWERGSGPTLACGSAAVAAVVAGVLEGRLQRKVSVTLPGGTLHIEWLADDNIKMSGSANYCFSGQIKIERAQLKEILPKAAMA